MNIFKPLLYHLFKPHKKGHGIHSPFVYSLIREVFMPAGESFLSEESKCASLSFPDGLLHRISITENSRKYLNLYCHLYHYFRFKSISYNSLPCTEVRPAMVFVDGLIEAFDSHWISDTKSGDMLILLSPSDALWNQIKAGTDATVTIDLLHIGFVFFDERLSEQHYCIYY